VAYDKKLNIFKRCQIIVRNSTGHERDMERGTKKPRWVPGLGNCIKSGSLDPTNRLTVSTVVQHAARGAQIE